MYTYTIKNNNTLAIRNAKNGQLVRTVTVDGNIAGSPMVNSDIGTVNVRKGNTNKVYVTNLNNGSVKKIFNV
jgi:outer membrane protein assembly factor BamB